MHPPIPPGPPDAPLPSLVSREDLCWPAGPQVLAARLYRSADRPNPAPLVLHLHGGAFVAGGLDQGVIVAEQLAQAGSVVLAVDYPKGPGRGFPAAIEVLDAALRRLCSQRDQLAQARSPVLVAGEEAGGNLAAALALMARDQAHVGLAGQILLGPMLDPCQGSASLRQADTGHSPCQWTRGWRAYLGQAVQGDHPYAAPAGTRRLAGLAPALLLSTEDDPMRDETLAYAQALRQAGVWVRQALLQGPCGWPASLMRHAPRADWAWLPLLRRQLKGFFQALPTAPVQPPLGWA